MLPRSGADADPRVVDEDVESVEALAVQRHDGGYRLLVADVRRHVLHDEALIRQPLAASARGSGLRAVSVSA